MIFTPSDLIGNFATPQFSSGNDTFNGGGGNSYDLNIQFTTSNSGGGINRFNLNDSITFNVNLPITAFTNNTNQLASIVHIQGIGEGGTQSTWLIPNTPQIPETSSLLLGSIGMVLLLNRKRYA